MFYLRFLLWGFLASLLFPTVVQAQSPYPTDRFDGFSGNTRRSRDIQRKEADFRKRQFELDRLVNLKNTPPHSGLPEQTLNREQILQNIGQLYNASRDLRLASIVPNHLHYKEISEYSNQVAKLSNQLRKGLTFKDKVGKVEPASLAGSPDTAGVLDQTGEQIDDQVQSTLMQCLSLLDTIDIRETIEICEKLEKIEKHALGMKAVVKK